VIDNKCEGDSLTHSMLRVTGCGSYSALHVDRSSASAHASAAVSPVSRTIWLIHVVRGLPDGRFQGDWDYDKSDAHSMRWTRRRVNRRRLTERRKLILQVRWCVS